MNQSTAPTILILAAGRGTRMVSDTPKMLHELCGQPLVLWPVRAAIAAGAGRVIVVDSPARELDGVLPEGVEVVIQPRSDGTGGAVAAAADQIDPDTIVVVLSGDVPLVAAQLIRQLVGAHVASDAVATMATTILADPTGYGRVRRDAEGAVERVVETKDTADATPADLGINEVNSGIYAFGPRPLLKALAGMSVDNAQGERYLPQVLDILRADGQTVAAYEVADPRVVLGVNDRAGLSRVRALAQTAIHERHMREGVTIVDPQTTEIDIDVAIGRDARIEPCTQLRGITTVGARTVVGPHATVIDSHIAHDAAVRASWLQEATVDSGAMVGPFAYLRPGTVLGERSKAGSYVEIKNSRIGAGAKIPHLSYIGDADVGEDTNLGAATITANYDGVAKHRTTIGRRVHTGVDTTLVAPVTLGDDSYTGAGSVVVKDIPGSALGVARARQRNIDGYAKRSAGQPRSS